MEEAKAISVAGYEQVLEDGPEEDTKDSEIEEHGDELTGMYTSDMRDAKGQPILARASMTTEQAEALRKTTMAGGRATGVGFIPTNVTTHLAVPRVVVAAGCKGLVRCADLIRPHARLRYARPW
jgi:hypothetical protein